MCLRPDGWAVDLDEQSEVYHIQLPRSGFVEMTLDGSYRPDTGSPFATVNDRKRAIGSWLRRGFAEEVAEREVSFFQARETPRGVAAVLRWNSYVGNPPGPFLIDTVPEPDVGAGTLGIGSFSIMPNK